MIKSPDIKVNPNVLKTLREGCHCRGKGVKYLKQEVV